MSGFIVRGRDITLDLGRGWGLSLDPYIYRCIASPALTTIHQELSTGLGTRQHFLWYCITSQCSENNCPLFEEDSTAPLPPNSLPLIVVLVSEGSTA